ncbi:hypothetical protein DFH06DRAFT_1021644, partial [Mycena polygramma]
ETKWQQQLVSGIVALKMLILYDLPVKAGKVERTVKLGYNRITCDFLPLLRDWHTQQQALRSQWDVAEEERPEDESEHPTYYLYNFHLFALRGARDALGLPAKYHDRFVGQ